MERYKIIRFYISGKQVVMGYGFSLEQAQAHCSDPKTSKKGVYFDGYTKQ